MSTDISKIVIEGKGKRKDLPDQMCPALICNDGYSISVQANRGAYCKPRHDGSDVYWEFELGFPSEADDLITHRAENPDDPTETVYAYVEAEIVNQLLDKHGGFKEYQQLEPKEPT